MLVGELGTVVEELFPDLFDEDREISVEEGNKRKRHVPVDLKVKKKKKVVGESSATVKQINQTIIATGHQPLDLAHNNEAVAVVVVVVVDAVAN